MRTLKKTLCLVLALAMMVGLCAVGASALTVNDYKDKDQIPNMEAFATLTAIGVFQGDDTGNVHPNEALKRAEGATLAAKMHATAGSGVSSFTDMGAYAWAQPAVAFCEANGLINGYGDGTFGPGDALSTVAFAKICLCAIGFDAEKEGLTGPQWEINTIKLVNALDLADGIGNPQWSDPIPRWQAGQFCYNTLKATMVDYSNGLNFTVTTSDGTKVEVGTGASAVINNSYDYRNELHSDKDDTMQFCEQFFPLLKMDTAGSVDFFGFESNAWYMGDTRVDRNRTVAKTIVTVNASETLAVYDTNIATVTGKTLYTDGKADIKHTTLKLIVNGYEVAKDVTMDRLGTKPLLSDYKGATAYLLDTDDMDKDGYGIADTLIVKYPYLATVTKITEASASADRTATLTVYDKDAKGTANVKFVTTDYAKGDFVLVYPNFKAAKGETFTTTAGLIPFTSELATTAAGTLSKYTNGASGVAALTIGGVAYSVGSNANLGLNGKTVATSTYALGTGMTAYLANGFVLGVVSDAVAYGDYVFAINNVPNSSALGNTTYTVGSVDQAGKATEVLGANVTATGASSTVKADDLKNVWATKAEASTGGFTFKPAKNLTKPFEINGLKSNQPTLGTDIVADNSTVFIIYNGATWKSYTGLNNVPNYATKTEDSAKGLKATAYALVPDTYAGAHAVAVYIDVTGATAKNTTTSTIYLVSNTKGGQEQGADGRTYDSYTAIIDGKVTSLLGTTTATLKDYGIVIPAYSGSYLAGTDNASNVPVNHAAISTNGDYVINADGGLLTFYLAGATTPTIYSLAPDAVAYVYAVGAALETDVPAAILNGLYDDSSVFAATISVELNTAGLVKTIYVNKTA